MKIMTYLVIPLFCFFVSLTTSVWSDADFYDETPLVYGGCGCEWQERFGFVAGDVSVGYENFRSLPDGSWEGNTGALISLNFGMPIFKLSSFGLGVQLGGSFGVYDWLGRGSALEGNNKAVQQQGFVSAGLFRKTPYDCGFNAGVVYDEMINKNFGVFSLNPCFGQVRGAASYLLCNENEFGLWGTVHTNTSHKATLDIPVAFHGINQLNLFWNHFFACAETSVWAGLPYGKSLMNSSSRPGQYIVGASFRVLLNECWSVDGRAVYMHPMHANGATESKNYASNICVTLNYFFGGTCEGNFRPYLPVANNTNFLADTSLNY